MSGQSINLRKSSPEDLRRGSCGARWVFGFYVEISSGVETAIPRPGLEMLTVVVDVRNRRLYSAVGGMNAHDQPIDPQATQTGHQEDQGSSLALHLQLAQR